MKPVYMHVWCEACQKYVKGWYFKPYKYEEVCCMKCAIKLEIWNTTSLEPEDMKGEFHLDMKVEEFLVMKSQREKRKSK